MTAESDDLVTGRGHVVPAGAMRWQATRSGGPGGQHANTSDTKVVYVLDVDAAELPPQVRERLVAAHGQMVRVSASDSRSQFRNRKIARQRLADVIDDAAKPQIKRRPTRPTRGSQRRRLDAKRARGQTKARRAWRPGDD